VIQEKIEGLQWAHPIDLGHGVITRKWYVQRRFQRRLRLLQIPENLKGWTVLDLGASDGYFAFECERRGAERVLAIDTYPGGKDTFLAAKEILESKVQYKCMDVHDLTAENTGQFDLVLFLGVFYHLRNPLIGLEKIVSLARKLLICETHLLIPFVHERYPLIPFFRGNGHGPGGGNEMCAIPTLECLRQMFAAVGMDEMVVKKTPSFKVYKKIMALLRNQPQSGRGVVHVRF